MAGHAASILALSDVTIGVLTALPIEFAAATKVLRCYQEVEADGRIYNLGQVLRRDGRGYHVVAITCLPTTGTQIAAIRAVKFKDDCPRVREVIMCGIAGAVPYPSKPSDHVRLGDVVTTNERGVLQYDFGRDLETGFVTEPRWFRPSRRLRESARYLESRAELGINPWNQHVQEAIDDFLATPAPDERWLRPSDSEDELREFDGERLLDYLVPAARLLRFPKRFARYRPRKHPVDRRRNAGKPRIFSGVVACANRLQKNPKRRDYLRNQHGARAIEMEGSGLAEAAAEVDMNFFVVRGTVDYCNPEKTDDWHPYASLIAAAYTYALLEATSAGTLLVDATEAPNVATAVVLAEHALSELDATSQVSPAVASAVLLDKVAHSAANLEHDVEQDGRRRMIAVCLALDTWDVRVAISLGDAFNNWMNDNRPSLSPSFLKDGYTVLARIATTKAQRATGADQEARLGEAQRFINAARQISQS